jgi:glyoxylase-like metal-dependent hydrolase (beta-lactamase superfamily II)
VIYTFGSTGKIIPLSEGSFTIDSTKLFVPFNEDEHELNDRPRGSLLVEVQPFCVITSKDILVLDAGLGFNISTGALQIHENVKNAGIDPKQVSKVLMTHLHKDHAGGIAFGPSHQWLSFPNAAYYIRRSEFEFAKQKGAPSFIPDELDALESSPQVVFLEEESGVIDDYIFYEHTGAHSPQHQVFWIKDQGEIIFFGGDDAPQLQQMKVKYKTKYDFNPEKAMQLRQQWWETGNREKWKFLFYHDIKIPVFEGR